MIIMQLSELHIGGGVLGLLVAFNDRNK